ncbi:hypothetical protein TrVFT333_010335 [Trichoderma virens FT-333]|nr:hypothetical protein TrVFT333_010335 [Trichoderma virens FT-333]
MDQKMPSDAAKRRHESKFLVYFIGFRDVTSNLKTISLVEMVKIIVPEAQIFQHNIFLNDSLGYFQEYDGVQEFTAISSHDYLTESAPEPITETSQNSASFINQAQHKIFSSKWIHYEALELLRRIQEYDSQKRVLLAAYGFGGLIVKEVNMKHSHSP